MRSLLQQIGMKYETDKATAHHYCDFYERELTNFRPLKILEIGVLNGASLRMWHEFYPGAIVIGIDFEKCAPVDGCVVLHADATDLFYLEVLFANHQFDLIIDDGSHFTKDQQIAFHYLFNQKLRPGGYYIMEDVHTSFIPAFVNSTFTTYDILKARYKCREYWDKPHKQDSGTLIIQK